MKSLRKKDMNDVIQLILGKQVAEYVFSYELFACDQCNHLADRVDGTTTDNGQVFERSTKCSKCRRFLMKHVEIEFGTLKLPCPECRGDTLHLCNLQE